MNLQNPPPKYDAQDQSAARHAIEREDRLNHKKNADVQILNPNSLILQSSDGMRWEIRVSTAGVLSAYSLPEPVALTGHGMTIAQGTLTP